MKLHAHNKNELGQRATSNYSVLLPVTRLLGDERAGANSNAQKGSAVAHEQTMMFILH